MYLVVQDYCSQCFNRQEAYGDYCGGNYHKAKPSERMRFWEYAQEHYTKKCLRLYTLHRDASLDICYDCLSILTGKYANILLS